MPEIVANPASLSCYHLFRAPGFQESQWLGSDPFWLRARDPRGLAFEGQSGRPGGQAPATVA
jgi:hypothetical protein